MAEYEDYLERIRDYLLVENFLFGCGFKDGWIFFRVERRETFPYLYDLFAEIPDFAGAGRVAMDPGQYVTAKELKCDTLAATNIFLVKEKHHAYQIFYGVSPSETRVFPAYPVTTEINTLDVGAHLPSYPHFGFIDGFESPLDKPSPRSMLIIPYGPKIGFAFHNPSPNPIKPMMRFIINRLEVSVVKDVDLIMKILDRKIKVTLATIGGIDNPWGTAPSNYLDWWGVLPVRLGATRDEVERAVRGVG
jgi:hypothetical protein